MTPERYANLMKDPHYTLSSDEIAAGWHFCREFDDLLAGPGMPELKFCTCYKTCPTCGND